MKKSKALALFALLTVLAILGLMIAKEANASTETQTSYGAGGRLHGFVYGFNVWDELVPVSWASITATQNGQIIDQAYSSDGFYEMYLPGGDFEVSVESPGYFTEQRSILMGDGSDYALDFYLERNNQPIPEYPIFAVQIAAVLSLAATLLILKKKRLVRK